MTEIFDPKKTIEFIERVRRGDFHPEKLLQDQAQLRRMIEARQAQKQVEPPSDQKTMPVLHGKTFEKLLKALEAYPNRYGMDAKPKLDDDLRPWLKKAIGCSSREADVFGVMLLEHFHPDSPIANKK